MLSSIALLSLLPLLTLGAPVLNTRGATTGRYIVVLQPEVESAASILSDLVDHKIRSSIKKHHVYHHGDFKGFTARLDAKHLASLQADPRVAYLEEDGVASLQIEPQKGAHIQVEKRDDEQGATWGLGRISHRQNGASDYLYESTGAGTCAYTIDTGVYADHPDFQGRAANVMSYTGVNTDDNGHGTHVAGTIGSATYGVAKQTMIYAIKVLDANGNGAWSDIISGLQFAVSDSATRSCPNGVVVNMSIGGDKTQSVDDAVAAAVNAGLFVAVAAGNDGVDFGNSSPADAQGAFAVGASDSTDAIASFSNFGATLGAFAPGVDVISTWNNGQTNTLSGTSMATPHITGIGAYLLALNNGPMSPASLRSWIQSFATTNVVGMADAISQSGTPNLLAFNGAGS